MNRANGNDEAIPIEIFRRREDLAGGLKQALESLPFVVEEFDQEVTVHFQELLICGVRIEEENYKIFHVSLEWKDKTTYLCEEDGDGTWFYYLESIDECIGEVRRLVMFEAKKPSAIKNGNHTSELRRTMTENVFEEAYKRFIVQADQNAISGKANGGRLPYSISKDDNERMTSIDGGGMSQHYGQGGAGHTPYINWHVVSVYYIPKTGQIVIGIEKKRYSHLNKMKPLRYSQIGSKPEDVAVFYETSKDTVDYGELYRKFIEVSEEVMNIGID